MANLFRCSIVAATVFIGLGGFAAIAAPSPAGDAGTAAPSDTAAPSASAKAKPHAMRQARPTVEQRIKDLHAKLHISPEQQPQWDGFAQVMRDNAHDMEQAFQQRVKTMPNMNAPENMQSYAEMAMNHAQDMQKLVPAFQSVWDVLTDSQRQVADQVFRDDGHRGKAMRHG
jgi:protein CpxP